MHDGVLVRISHKNKIISVIRPENSRKKKIIYLSRLIYKSPCLELISKPQVPLIFMYPDNLWKVTVSIPTFVLLTHSSQEQYPFHLSFLRCRISIALKLQCFLYMHVAFLPCVLICICVAPSSIKSCFAHLVPFPETH